MENVICDNIQNVIDNALCSACGGCAGICPVNAITMQENAAGFLCANIDNSKCISCRKCISICPSNGLRLGENLVGNIINGYIGYAQNSTIRLQGQSGGIVTAIIQWMIENHKVDAVVVSGFDCEKKRAKAFLASTVEEILSAKGSHYTQTSPVELILKNQDKKLAAVLLGCQTVCLEQIKKKYPKINLPILTIGLICGGNLSGYVVDDLLKKAKIKESDTIKSFRFRDKAEGGWPGDIVINSKARRVCIPKEKRMEIKPYYQNYRCMLCAEKMNQCCDIVVGDPWGISIPDEANGYSAIITRTMKGQNLLNEAVKEDIISMQNEEPCKIIEGQKIETALKEQLASYDLILKKYGWIAPYKTFPEDKEIIYSEEMFDKLNYLRTLQYAKSKEEAKNIINKRKRNEHHPVREVLYNIKKRIIG